MHVLPLSRSSFDHLSILPLCSTPLFPGTALPLHVVEQRYISLIDEALGAKGEGIIGIVLMHKGADAQQLRPPIYEMGCAGRIIKHERHQDGTVHILVHGLMRVRLLEEWPSKNGCRYFKTQAIPLPESINALSELARLHHCILALGLSTQNRDAQLSQILAATPDPVQLTDILSAIMIPDPHHRQRLLAATDLKVRVAALIDHLAESIVHASMSILEEQLN